MPKADKPKYVPPVKFDYSLDYANLNLRQNPHLYCIGKGEQGVLSVEPYKSEILPLWRFKTPEIAETSSQQLKGKFEEYKEANDFIGMDMTRKFIQMGVTRARRYANWSGGKKYTGELDERGKKITVVKGEEDPVKAESARIFGVVLKEVRDDEEYKKMAQIHRDTYESAQRAKTAVKRQKFKKEESVEETGTSPSQTSTRQTRSSVKLEQNQ